MKTIYFLYMILFRDMSIMQIDPKLDGNIKWAALDTPQDGYSGHKGNWLEADTAIEAVWRFKGRRS